VADKIFGDKMDSDLLKKIVYASFRRAWEEDRGGFPPPSDTIYVTEVSQCLLKSWFQRTVAEPPSDNKIILMVMGDSAHYLMKDYFPLGSGEMGVEKTIDGVKIKGRADRVGEDFIIEFKTVSYIPKSPYEAHIKQAQLYLWLFEKNIAFIIYVSRANGEINIFRIERDDKLIKELLDRAKILSSYLKRGVMPKPEKSNLCNYCEYIDLCPLKKMGESNESK